MTSVRVLTILALAALAGAASAQAPAPAQRTVTADRLQPRREVLVRPTEAPAAKVVDLKKVLTARPVVVGPTLDTTPVTPAPAEPAPAAPAAPPEPAPAPSAIPPAATPTLRPGLYAKALRPAEEVTLKDDLHRQIGEMKIWSVPGVIQQVNEAGQELPLKAFVLEGQPLHLANGLYRGTIQVGVVEVGGMGGARALTEPVEFQVLGGAGEPDVVRVSHTSVPYEKISIGLTSAHDGSSVRVASRFDPAGVEVKLPMAPVLELTPETAVIDGLGLETVKINVALSGLKSPKGMVVRLKAIPAAYLASTVVLDERGNGAAVLRSSGIGKATITATAEGFIAEPQTIEFRLPLLTFLASLIGALVGGLIRLLQARRKSKAAGLPALAAAMLCGVLVFALYAVGVNVLPITPVVQVGSIVVFVVSGLGAFLGTALLKPRAA